MLSVDGTEQYQLKGSWINPLQTVNPNFGGTRVVLRDVSGNDEVIGNYGPLITSFVSEWRPIIPGATYTMYYVSLDGNGNANSIVPGITPGFGGIAPVAQTTGKLNGGRFDTLSLNGLTVSGGKLQPNATGGLSVIAGAIQMAGSVDVGTAQAMTGIYIKPASSIIGFIGSDVPSGYSGGWFSQIKGGGSGPANAPLYTDSLGNVFLDATLGGGNVSILGGTFSLNLNGITTTIANNLLFATAGLEVKNNSTSEQSLVGSAAFILLNSVGTNVAALQQASLSFGGIAVVGSRKTGWTASSGTPLKTGWATGSATLLQVAETVKALIDDLFAHGLIGT